MKTCTCCGVEKPFSEYSKHKLGKNGLRPRCRTCTAVEGAVYRAATIEKRSDYNREYRKKNRERHVAYNKAWNKANRERMNEIVRDYRRRNPELVRARSSLSHAIRKGGADNGYATGRKVLERINYYGGKCAYCGNTADTIDHRVALSRGGTNLPANIVPACRSCNSSKGNRPLSKWKGVTSPAHANVTF